MSEVQLKVEDSRQSDVGRGIARIDIVTMEKLGIRAGDIVEITNKHTTSAVAWVAYSEDQGLGIIRIDGFTRKNAGAFINEYVVVKPAKVETAASITLAPVDMRLNVDKEFTDFVKQRLLERTMVEGNITVVMMLGHAIPFTATKTAPSGIVKVTDKSRIVILNEPISNEALQKVQVSPSVESCIEELRGISDEMFEKLVESVIVNFFFDRKQFNPEEIAKETGTSKELVQSTVIFLRDGLVWNNFTGNLSIGSFQRNLLDVYKYPQTKIGILTKHFEKNKNELRLNLMFRQIQELNGKLQATQSLSEISTDLKDLKQLYGHVLDVCANIKENVALMRQEQQKSEESNPQKQKRKIF